MPRPSFLSTISEYLHRHRPAFYTVEELAERTDCSTAVVRRHLRTLVREGSATSRLRSEFSVGRPAYEYAHFRSLTAMGPPISPSWNDMLMVSGQPLLIDEAPEEEGFDPAEFEMELFGELSFDWDSDE